MLVCALINSSLSPACQSPDRHAAMVNICHQRINIYETTRHQFTTRMNRIIEESKEQLQRITQQCADEITKIAREQHATIQDNQWSTEKEAIDVIKISKLLTRREEIVAAENEKRRVALMSLRDEFEDVMDTLKSQIALDEQQYGPLLSSV